MVSINPLKGDPMTKLLNRASDVLAGLAMLCLLLMMFQVVGDVVLKYAFNAPIENNLEIVSFYYMVAVVFLPLAMVERRHEHINVDLFVLLLPKRVQQIIYAFAAVTACLFFALLAYQTCLDAFNSTAKGEVMMGTNLVPIWPTRWLLPVGFSLISLMTLNHAARALVDPAFDPIPETPELETDIPKPEKRRS